MMERKYYEAYDDRYRQVHEQNLRWFSDTPSAIVGETILEFGISPEAQILEIGCGEGRDARFLLHKGFPVLATDISPEAINCCQKDDPEFAENYQVLDCIRGRLETKFDFIHDQLSEKGVALICTMGDGIGEMRSDIRTAFECREREHQESGRMMLLAGTSCRMVSFDTFCKEITRNDLDLCKQGLTSVNSDFPQMMYAVVKRKS